MSRTVATRTIDAPAGTVFRVVSDIGEFSTAVPEIIGLLARITLPFMRGMIRKAVEKDMDAVKEFCESGKAAGTGREPDPE